MIHFRRCKFKAGLDVFRFKVRKIGENLRFRNTSGQHFENIFDPDTHPPNAGTSPALLWVKGNP